MSGFSIPGLGIFGDAAPPGEDYWADQEDADLLRMFEEIEDDRGLQALQTQNESLVAAELRSRLRGDARKAKRSRKSRSKS